MSEPNPDRGTPPSPRPHSAVSWQLLRGVSFVALGLVTLLGILGAWASLALAIHLIERPPKPPANLVWLVAIFGGGASMVVTTLATYSWIRLFQKARRPNGD